MLKRLGESILGILSFVFFLVLGIAAVALSFFRYFLPKREREWRAAESAEAAKRAASIKAEISKAHEKRAAETTAAVVEIEKKAEESKKRDSVALANDLLKE